jgi:cytochrome c oxidase subunit II
MRPLLPGVLAGIALAGCREVQPVLSAYSVEADVIARLSWVLFFGGGAILLLVVAAVWTAARGPAALRRHLATPRMVLTGGVVFPAVVLAALLFLNVALMHSAARAPPDKPGTVPITVSGEQWWWRVVYTAPGGGTFESANEIRIPVGRDVVFTLRSADVIHSFWVPSLGGKVDMIPGRDTRLRVHATRHGVFRGPCAEYCGGAHALMALQVTAMPADEFDAWLSREGAGAAPAQDERAREGERLFVASGCGTCHAVRGTPAAGTIGPDLTHLASRTSIGADTLPLDRINLSRFIAEGQKVKPGNRMPEFRIYSSHQRDALVSYLLGLR